MNEEASIASSQSAEVSFGGDDSFVGNIRMQRPFGASSKTEASPDNHMKRVARLRRIVCASLLLTGIISSASIVAFSLHLNSDCNEQSQQIESLSLELASSAQAKIRDVVGEARSMSTSITSMTSSTHHQNTSAITWPFVTIPDFERRTDTMRQLANAADVYFFAPIVHHNYVPAWEKYSVENRHWLQESLNVNRQGIRSSDIPHNIHEFRSDTPIGSTESRVMTLPLWQVGPAPWNASIINVDLASDARLGALANKAKESRKTVISTFLDLTPLVEYSKIKFDADDSPSPTDENFGLENKNVPRNMILSPIYETFDDNSTVVGYIGAVVNWPKLFDNVLVGDNSGEAYIRLYDTCSTDENVVLKINGTTATLLTESQEHTETMDFASNTIIPANGLDGIVLSANGKSCEVHVFVYSNFESNCRKWSIAAVVLASASAIFLFIAVIALSKYDSNMKKQQETVKANAEVSLNLLSTLFPHNVQRRILQNVEHSVSQRSLTTTSSRGKKASLSPRNKVQEFLDSEMSLGPSSHFAMWKGKAIADLFPETTVMFADIVGFTAWSSAREPTQVFLLLETIYHQFDELARRRGVFKVETIGDCYVAVCGLPEPRKDHAVTMARFARDCLLKFVKLIRYLEAHLGPDTAELGLRIGLHSGPVTAGVLRGERTRFQLFGDTVNTTARMESTGMTNRIQISEEVAEQLAAAGKGEWYTLRSDAVIAKGKGELQTYWLIVQSQSSGNQPFGSKHESQHTSGESDSGQALDDDCEHLSASSVSTAGNKTRRLIDWSSTVLLRLLEEIVARRKASDIPSASSQVLSSLEKQKRLGTTLDEVKEIVELPKFKAIKNEIQRRPQVSDLVKMQLRGFVQTIAAMYRPNAFHNFEHASHVTMSTVKLLSRIVAPDIECKKKDNVAKKIHDHTYGITSDPLTQFSIILSALIHDVDHLGVPNSQLVKEQVRVAAAYKNKSVAEQNSIDLAWELLMDENFLELRRTIYATETEYHRFRQLLVNTVLATDIMDKDLKELRNARWSKAFQEASATSDLQEAVNRKATIVIEHLIQASDVSHTMQHWHVYRKWNERLFLEMYTAYKEGRSESNPADTWYEGEIGFFDYYIIPLAKKLKDCGVFGVSSDEYLNYAEQNRKEWERKGKQVVEYLIERYIRAHELLPVEDEALSDVDSFAEASCHSRG